MGLLNTTLIGIVVVLAGFFLTRLYNPNTVVEPNKVIVIGGGLAGMSAAMEAHKRGAEVILIEKEQRLGGNSAKASSGINAVGTTAQHSSHSTDTISTFVGDTLKSGGGACMEELVRTMVHASAEAVSFLTSLGVDLSVLSKCGGHMHARTHRASPPLPGQPARNIGFEITSKLIEHLNKTSSIQVITGARVQKLIRSEQGGGRVVGVTYEETKTGRVHELRGSAVVLSAGGFGADRRPGGLLEKYGLKDLPTTNGAWATGDAARLFEGVGAKMVLMDQVQIHPTGFVDPKDPSNPTKFLAPEALRAVGGILINKEGRRFVDELSYRNLVAPAIFSHGFRIGDKEEKEGEEKGTEGKGFMAAYMLLNDAAVDAFGAAALKFYMSKGFIVKYASADQFVTATGVDKDTLLQTFSTYNSAAASGGPDEFGKTTFPLSFDPSSPLNVVIVTPSIHYTMGGALITPNASVVGVDGNIIPGLYAAGEASGGVHGNNRLAGNSLLECVVYGRIAGINAATPFN